MNADTNSTKGCAIPTFYMDESGYTGGDLLNRQQPFQATSALRIDEDAARRIADQCFPRRQSVELKHKNMKKRPSNWKPLAEVQELILRDYSGFSFVCDKRYFLILRLLDICVEPVFYDHGANFFENGLNYALASLLYYAAPKSWGKQAFDDLLWLFQRGVNQKLEVNVQTLVHKARSLQGRELAQYLQPL